MGLREGVEPSSPRYDGGARPTTGAGALGEVRTLDLVLTKNVLFHLSYKGLAATIANLTL